MSYNITAWKVRSMRLVLPLDFHFRHWLESQPDRDKDGYENTGKRWCLEDSSLTLNLETRTWTLDASGQELAGTIEDDQLVATDVDWTSDGSGRLYGDILLPLFKDFKGNLDALVVWEGGDTITQLSIQGGVVDEVEVK